MLVKEVLTDNNMLNNVINDILLSNEFCLIKDTTEFKDSNLYLKNEPSSLYSKHNKVWLKIRYQLYIDQDDKMIPYAYHGFFNSDYELVSRECHSLHHKVISNEITEILNDNRIGEIIKEIAIF